MDPLTDIVRLLHPRTVLLGSMAASGRWGVRLPEQPGPTFYVVVRGECWFRSSDHPPVALREGDYVLSSAPMTDEVVSAPDARASLSDAAFKAERTIDGELRLGDVATPPTTRVLGGLILCDPGNADLLTGLLPRYVHVRASEETGARLRALLDLVRDESDHDRPGRDVILSRLIEVMLVETVRHEAAAKGYPAGIVSGLADPQLARALAHIHADVGRGWTIADLARRVGMSRSAFARRFVRAVGAAPLEYLLQWRMALAKDALRHGRGSLDEIAALIGYQSASAFSTAFKRYVGCPPSLYAGDTGELRAGA